MLAQVSIDHVSTHFTGIFDEGAAEIVTYDEGSQKLFFSNAEDNSVGILDFTDPSALTLLQTIDIDPYGDGVNSVAAFEGIIAVAVEIDESPGRVVFFDHDGTFLSQVEVGFLPDMLTYTHDGQKVVVACEGEPNSDWTFDPAGSVAIIDVSGGIENLSQGDVTLVSIGSYTGSWEGVRIFGPDYIPVFEETFQDTALELNHFYTYNELSTNPWYYDQFNDDYFAEANGFGDDTASIDWLISGLINLSGFSEVFVSFQNTRSFSGGSLDLLISADFDGIGDPSNASWDTLTTLAVWSSGGYIDTNSGMIDISTYVGMDVVIAFLYKSTGNGGGEGALWQIDDVIINGSRSNEANLEPEYIAISADNSTAFVALQENNALAVVDISTGVVSNVLPLGWKDHSIDGQGLDASDRDDEINIATYPFRGLYLPDAIAAIEIGGTQYVISANEGDARDYDAYAEEERLEDVTLDPSAFPDAATLQLEENGGRINITTSMGDIDGDGDFDEIYTFGARSFTIWDTDGNLVFDSGDEFEQKMAEMFPVDFNSGNDANQDFDSRSDAKGPEPEAVEVAEIYERVYAFIGLERMGGIMMYDITDPVNASFVTYVNNRDFSVIDVTSDEVGDLGCEDVLYISDTQSPDGKHYLVSSNEVSGTVSVFEINGLLNADHVPAEMSWSIFPNPVMDKLYFGETDNYMITDSRGVIVMYLNKANEAEIGALNPGVYFVKNAAGEAKSFVKN